MRSQIQSSDLQQETKAKQHIRTFRVVIKRKGLAGRLRIEATQDEGVGVSLASSIMRWTLLAFRCSLVQEDTGSVPRTNIIRHYAAYH